MQHEGNAITIPNAVARCFARLTDVGEVSDPVDEGTSGITIYQLLELSDRRAISDDRLQRIRTNGFERWVNEEVRAGANSWIDPEFAPSSSTNSNA